MRRFVPLTKENTAVFNLLVFMLSSRTARYPSRQALVSAASHAYGMRYGWGINGYGTKMLVEFRAAWLKSDFVLQQDYAKEAASLIESLLFEPLLDQEGLEEAHYMLLNRISLMEQDPDSRAMKEALGHAQKGHNIEIFMFGEPERIETVTLEDVKNAWQMLCEQPAALLKDGKLEPEIEQAVCDCIDSMPASTQTVLLSAHEPNRIVLEKDIHQTSLAQVYATGVSWNDKVSSMRLMLFNSLFGGSSTSLLFSIIREKYSYCYSISTNLIRFDGALVLTTGTLRRHVSQVQELIAQILESIVQMEYDPQALRLAKNELIDAMSGQQDSLRAMMEQEFLDMLRTEKWEMEECLQIIENTTAQDLVPIARSLSLISECMVMEKEEAMVEEEEADEEVSD